MRYVVLTVSEFHGISFLSQYVTAWTRQQISDFILPLNLNRHHLTKLSPLACPLMPTVVRFTLPWRRRNQISLMTTTKCLYATTGCWMVSVISMKTATSLMGRKRLTIGEYYCVLIRNRFEWFSLVLPYPFRFFSSRSFQANDALNDVDVHDPTRNRMDAPLNLPYPLASTRLAYFAFQSPDLRSLAVSKKRGK